MRDMMGSKTPHSTGEVYSKQVARDKWLGMSGMRQEREDACSGMPREVAVRICRRQQGHNEGGEGPGTYCLATV